MKDSWPDNASSVFLKVPFNVMIPWPVKTTVPPFLIYNALSEDEPGIKFPYMKSFVENAEVLAPPT